MKDRDALLAKARRVLEWDAVLEALAGRTVSTVGAERCRALALAESLDEVRALLRETAEMAVLEEAGGFPLSQFPDPREIVDRAAKGAPLLASDCRDLSVVLGLTAGVRRFLAGRDDTPALAAIAAGLDELKVLKAAIDRCVDAEGNVRESATPELRDLTHQANALKQKIRAKLDGILGSSRYADLLQEQYFAQRENRYVVPVKAERKSEVPGIVHDVSASGATVFIEPRELVDLNNAIKEADLAVEREVRRILLDLTQQAAAHADALRADVEILGRFDCLRAKASLGRLLKAAVPAVNADGCIRLRQARHPLLLLSRLQNGDPVVPNDIELADAARVLIISGPNTGGKTVTLKIVGLYALMVRAGIPLPCSEDSDMAFFPEVYADIGDAQDLTKDLSSFSAHVTDMIALLESAQPGSLVLLDEPVTSTDPAEGAALAEALLARLAERRFTVVATTHYNQLKALAKTRPGFANASVEFNITTLAPTYRLILGVPGGSSAIDIAGRLGMDETILDEALSLVDRKERAVEQLMEDLHETRRKLDEQARHAVQLMAEAESAARLQKESAARQAETEKETRKTARRKVGDELLKARAEAQAVLDELKADKKVAKAREAKERLAEIEAAMRARLGTAGEDRPVSELRVGDRVEATRLGAVGVLLESPEGKKRVRVRMGGKEVSVSVSELAGADGSGPEGPVQNTAGARRAQSGPSDAAAVLDVRGKTAEEAREALLAGLDAALLEGTPVVRIIHGHGTGRLKQVLREYLKESPYVSAFRPGERAEGGDGVTIVSLK